MTTEQIRDQISSYLLGDVSLDQFEDWFVSQSWNVHRSSSLEVQELVFELEAMLSEYSDGRLDERSLRTQLGNYASRYSETITLGGVPAAQIQTGSSYTFMPAAELQIKSVDIQPALECV